MLRIWIHETRPTGPWRELYNGPFPITREQLDEARRRFRTEWQEAGADENPLAGIRCAPQTTARAILDDIRPGLDAVDKGMIGFAVTNPFPIKTDEE